MESDVNSHAFLNQMMENESRRFRNYNLRLILEK